MDKTQHDAPKALDKKRVLLVVGLVCAVLLIVVFVVSQPDSSAPSADRQNASLPSSAAVNTAPIASYSSTPSEITAETTAPASSSTSPEESEDAPETENTSQTDEYEETPPPSVELTQQAQAEYEPWLAAAMLIGVSMEYPDFEFGGLYTSSATALEDKFSSQGVYLLFTSAGESLALHSIPLEAERTQSGTRDISTQNLGFASFDLVEPSFVDTESMTELKLESMSELIAQSLLVSVYTH